MELRIDQNVLDRFPSLHIVQENNVVTVKFDDENDSDFFFPENLPMNDLNRISWKKIDEIGRSGKAREFFALGAKKEDHMKNGFVAVYQIIGFDHDDLVDSDNKAAITWEMVSLYQEEKAMKENGDSVWWDETDLRDFLNNEFKNLVSDELAAIVKPVWKYSKDRKGELKKTIDTFWLKSEQEKYGRKFYSYGGEGKWYEFYKQEDVDYSKKMPDGNENWESLRSVYADSSYYFCFVSTSGSAFYSGAYFSFGFAPDFCS